jgi:hypothetical protein
MALNTGPATAGFHYGLDEEVTPQLEVRALVQVRVVALLGTCEPVRDRS